MANRAKTLSKTEYKDCKIEIVEKDADQGIKINGKNFQHHQDADTGAFYCVEAPYQVFGSLDELAKAVVDVQLEK